MRFLGYTYSREEESRVVGLLHSKGIPTYVRSSVLSRMPYRTAVFVCIGEQLADAAAVLRDPSHRVECQIDVSEYQRALAAQDHSLILKWATGVLAVVVVLFAIVVGGTQ